LRIGLSRRISPIRDVKSGQAVCRSEVQIDGNDAGERFRRETEEKFKKKEESVT
jgi:hypothetical protein